MFPIPPELQALLHQSLADAGVADPERYRWAWDTEPFTLEPMVRQPPLELIRLEQAGREWAARLPTWAYVSGGRALHAIFPDSAVPICGVDPLRGNPPHPPRWHARTDGDRWAWDAGYRHRHALCVRLAAQREAADQQARQRLREEAP